MKRLLILLAFLSIGTFAIAEDYKYPSSSVAGRYGSGINQISDIRIDSATDATTTVSYEHHEIHGGSHYFVCGSSVMASAAVIDFQLTTSNTTKWIHMTFQFESTQEMQLEIYEAAAVSADGDAVTAYNNNRNSSNTTSLVLLQANGTVNTAGNLIYKQITGVAGNANKARQGVGQRDKEIITKQNTTYRFVFTSGGAANNFSYCGEWYEHTNRR